VELDLDIKFNDDDKELFAELPLVIKSKFDDLFNISVVKMNFVRASSIRPEVQFLFRRVTELTFKHSKPSCDHFAAFHKYLASLQNSSTKRCQLSMHVSICNEKARNYVNLSQITENIDQLEKYDSLEIKGAERKQLLVLGSGCKVDGKTDQPIFVGCLYADSFAHVQNVTRLDELRISNINVRLIYPRTFVKFERLQTLELNNLGLPEIKAYAFAGLSQLKTLDLSKNALKRIEPEVFFGLSNLVSLNLRNNMLVDLQPGMFSALRKLEKLNLSLNVKLTKASLHHKSFDGLVSLKTLIINRPLAEFAFKVKAMLGPTCTVAATWSFF
jgi:hypothetical protein